MITNPQGVALDGENTVGGTSTGAQLALPSGNGYPGGNFFDSFIINTTPPSVVAGSLTMDPASDTNIVGDDITMSTLPTFDGTISEPNPSWCPSPARPPSSTSASSDGQRRVDHLLRARARCPRPTSPSSSAGCGHRHLDDRRRVPGHGGRRRSQYRARDQHQRAAHLFGTYNVGSSGVLSPLPGTDSGYYVARVRIIDQSGNQSNPNDPNAQVPFVVDNTPPTVTFTSPTSGQVITSLTNGVLSFTITTNKNIDLTHFTAASIELINAGPDGILGTADDVTIPINPSSITVTYLDKGTGGPGAEQITFSSDRDTLTNNLYAVTLLNTGTGRGSRHRRQRAGQPRDAQSSRSPCRRWPRTCSSKREPTPTTATWQPAKTPTRRSARP